MSRLSISDNIVIIGEISLFVYFVLTYLAKLPETDSPILKDMPTYALIIGIIMLASGFCTRSTNQENQNNFTGTPVRHI